MNVVQFISDIHNQQAIATTGRSQGQAMTPNNHNFQQARGMEKIDQCEQNAEQIIRNAERSKARVYNIQGKDLNITYHSALLDEDYLLVGNYVNQGTRAKIANGEYVDFFKLMLRDKIGVDEDPQHMEMVNKGGLSYWMPLSDRENMTISSYSKWEQAFRVFSNIYTEYFPTRSNELIQYNHIIHTASQTYSWDNVYRYDHEFCIHMSRHQTRNWGVILQEAWSMFLKDHVSHYSGNRGSNSNG